MFLMSFKIYQKLKANASAILYMCTQENQFFAEYLMDIHFMSPHGQIVKLGLSAHFTDLV